MIERLPEPKPGESFETIEISFPARAELVMLARFAAATVAARAGFDVEEIEDLRLAVDELCISLGPMADDCSLRIRLERAGDTVTITGSLEPYAESGTVSRPEPDSVTWKRAAALSALLLDSLVDEHGRDERSEIGFAWLRKRHAQVS